MIPLRDTIKSRTIPYMTWTLTGLNALVFIYELTLSPGESHQFFYNFGIISSQFDFLKPFSILTGVMPGLDLFTHMFLHGGWFHFLSNMWILYIFGDNVEDRMGSGRFLLFYLIGGVTAGLTQIIANPNSNIPTIGASGAIATVLGAYFIMFPGSRIVTLIPVFIIPWFVRIPAVFYLGFWFLSQVFSGIVSNALPPGVGGVAWWAHIGGFVFGLLLHKSFLRKVLPVQHYTPRDFS